MPNWCNNKLTILGPAADVKTLVEKARGGTQHYAPHKYDLEEQERERQICKKQGKPYVPHHEKVIEFSFHQLVPIPDEIMEKQYDPAGYQMEQELWGCKWGSSESKLIRHKDGRADYEFETPWAPPARFLEALSKKMPRLTFALSFGEEFPSRGRFLVKKGECADKIYDQLPEGYEKDPEYKKIPKDDEDARFGWFQKWQAKYLEEHEVWVEKLSEKKKK